MDTAATTHRSHLFFLFLFLLPVTAVQQHSNPFASQTPHPTHSRTMPPRPVAAVSRRAKRVIQSDSPSSPEPEPELEPIPSALPSDDEVEEVDEDEEVEELDEVDDVDVEEDAEGEYESEEEAEAVPGRSGGE